MKVVLAGAFGHLGSDILRCLINEGHTVIAAGRTDKKIEGLPYTFFPIDVTKPETLYGLCDGADVLITTVGLTGASKTLTCMDIDYTGNLNLLKEAQRAGVTYINYVSVIACDHPDAKKVPMLHAKYQLEQKLKSMCAASNDKMHYTIYRPTGYFYDIVHVFRPYVEKGQMQLLKGFGNIKANVISCPDLAAFIVKHMCDCNASYDIGGKETYTYEEITRLCFRAAKKTLKIKYVPIFLFSILANLPKIRKEGKRDVILFSRFTLSHDLVGDTITGNDSFKDYIKESFKS